MTFNNIQNVKTKSIKFVEGRINLDEEVSKIIESLEEAYFTFKINVIDIKLNYYSIGETVVSSEKTYVNILILYSVLEEQQKQKI